MTSVGDTAAELFISKGIPYLTKKGTEAGRYYASEFMRNPKLQKKAIDWGIKKATPVIQKVGSEALDQLSTKVRPNYKYKTDRMDLDADMYKGGAIDIHKAIGKLPRPKAGFTPGKCKYMGPYNPLEKQLEYNPNTGEVTKWYVQPYNRVDEIAAYHDICYDMDKNKGDCDRKIVASLDEISFGEMAKWGSTARFLIDKKQKLGLGVPKNGKRRRETGKKN